MPTGRARSGASTPTAATWPEYILPEFNGYSIGQWHDENGDGVYDMLSIETRGMKGPRSFDSAAVVLHDNNQTVVHEEIRRIDESTLEDRITTIDDALTGPWTVNRRYRLEQDNPVWVEYVCAEGNRHIKLGDEWYFVNDETGTLDPTRVGPAAARSGSALIPRKRSLAMRPRTRNTAARRTDRSRYRTDGSCWPVQQQLRCNPRVSRYEECFHQH